MSQPKSDTKDSTITDVPRPAIRQSIRCRLGFHGWKTIIAEGINLLCMLGPSTHIQECQRCGKCRRIGYTYHGCAVYESKNRDDAGVISPNDTHKNVPLIPKDERNNEEIQIANSPSSVLPSKTLVYLGD